MSRDHHNIHDLIHAQRLGLDLPGAPPMTEHRHPKPKPSDSEAVQETLSRARRIETRLTSLLVALGYDTETQKPELLRDGTIRIPSPHTSWREIIDAIPKDWTGPVDIYIRNEFVGTIEPPTPK